MSLLILLVLFARADEEPPEKQRMPVIGRPAEHFYNAAGSGVTVMAEASPTEVPLDDWLTFKLTISKLLNPADVEKPLLQALPEFKGFQINESSDLDPPPSPGQRVFIYKLRPLSESIEYIPQIAYHYYDHRKKVLETRPQDKFPKTYSNAVTIQVLPRALPPVLPPVPLVVPAYARQLANLNEARAFRAWLGWLIFFGVPLLIFGWIAAWKSRYPDEARLRQVKRHRAARHVFAALRRSAADAHAVILAYLEERFDLPAGARTPSEVTDYLGSSLAPALVEQTAAFLRDCDAVRFAGTDPSPLANEAERLVVALEDRA